MYSQRWPNVYAALRHKVRLHSLLQTTVQQCCYYAKENPASTQLPTGHPTHTYFVAVQDGFCRELEPPAACGERERVSSIKHDTHTHTSHPIHGRRTPPTVVVVLHVYLRTVLTCCSTQGNSFPHNSPRPFPRTPSGTPPAPPNASLRPSFSLLFPTDVPILAQPGRPDRT